MKPALIAIAGCLAALAIAHGAERFAGMIPCPLCLLERWPYRIGLLAGILALLAPFPWRRLALAATLAATLTAAGLAALHAGVEQHWWPSPLPECSAPRFAGMTIAQRLAAMRDRPSKSCEDADYPIRAIPLTFAQANLLWALALSAAIAISGAKTLTPPRRHTREPAR